VIFARNEGLELNENDDWGDIEDDVPTIFNKEEVGRRVASTTNAKFVRRAVTPYEGLWRTYRISSRTGTRDVFEAKRARVNVGLLNIKPMHVLRRLRRAIPEFSFFQGSDDPATTTKSQIRGVVGATGDCITLFGEREFNSGGLGYIGMISWLPPSVIEQHEHKIEAVCCVPNSEGTLMISSYLTAIFVDGSDKWKHETYLSEREEHLRQVGAKDIEQLIKGLDERTATYIKDMAQKCSNELIFVTRG
jgi:hypothetical protein